ncbi:MAG TPA: vanadium-dependent haloperoxidase [Nocardioides sp.]|nr:vanadium-dependent haloperoxidase [Nocardioides sp.]
MPTRRRTLAATAVLLAPLLVVPLTAPAASAAGSLASSIAVDWQRTAARTIYVERGTAPPLGSLYLSFTSLAVHDAAVEAQRHGSHVAAAAVATAAHDVLREYFALSGAALDADLAKSLAMVPNGKKEKLGVAIGAAAADEMIASRVGDGRGDPQYVYRKTAALGIWPAVTMAGGMPLPGMALPWLGFVDPVVDVDPVALDGPDHYTTPAFAADYEEARTLGSTAGTSRTQAQTDVAVFFSNNPMLMYRNALCDHLGTEPLGLLPTTRLFARIDAATATTFIESWRMKYEIGFWRPDQAVDAALTDGNPGTHAHPVDWVPLVTNPAYSDYTSGHGSATSPFAEVLRQTLGDDTALLLKAGALQRPYATLSALEHDALHARIWGGLHFRDSMEDTYHLGHATADQVMKAVK